jgi:hypothetical protein
MVVGRYIDLEKVEGLTKLALVGYCMGKMVKGEALKSWMESRWGKSWAIFLDSSC